MLIIFSSIGQYTNFLSPVNPLKALILSRFLYFALYLQINKTTAQCATIAHCAVNEINMIHFIRNIMS